jgi:hypothetical protein
MYKNGLYTVHLDQRTEQLYKVSATSVRVYFSKKNK